MATPELHISSTLGAGRAFGVIADNALAKRASNHEIIDRSRAKAAESHLGYAGDLTPTEAFELLSVGAARLVDIRTPEERKFVGYVPDSVAVAWATGTAFTRNPRFVRELESKFRKDEVLLFICRSGARSVLAAEVATRAQFTNVFNVLEGFEGDIDIERRRGRNGGWRFRGLPWIQD